MYFLHKAEHILSFIFVIKITMQTKLHNVMGVHGECIVRTYTAQNI